MTEPKMKLTDAEAEAFIRYLTQPNKKKRKHAIDELIDTLLKTKRGRDYLKKWKERK
jgi:hypothetical protein